MANRKIIQSLGMVIENYIQVPMIVNFGSDLVLQKLKNCNGSTIDTTSFVQNIYNDMLATKMHQLNIPDRNILDKKVSFLESKTNL